MFTASRIKTSLLSAAIAGGMILAPVQAPAHAQDLGQVVEATENHAPAGEQTVIDQGHVDLGLVEADGQLQLKARDDTSEPPVWRGLDDVVFHVNDVAQQQLPDTQEYNFTGATGGDNLWVVPQTEVAGVVWLGWNTQHPSLLDSTDQGVTMKILGHSGEGDAAVFLQSGGFGAPEILYSSVDKPEGEFFVELNSHVHANWTFTHPGIHQMLVEMSTDSQSSQAVLTFAVGSNTDTQQGFSATYDGATEVSSSSNTWLWWGLGIGVVLVVGGVIFWRSRRG